LVAKVAWWGWAYLAIVYGLCQLLDREPDDVKVGRVLNRAVRVKAIPL
jgi:hypothetical protein